mmetsp:Transcript_36809/g.103850  ORF Transcript_36809/g.103850 Transcript_36809/m.103850 type:complete len:603 (-) Transcript_36809:276-2084(-)
MGGIEVITAKTYKGPNGEDLNVWNPTVANLTLMALGSSAPEILLSILGVVMARDQPADELGPATIVGSASFNLLIISAVCVVAPIPDGRKVAQVGVFALTSICSVWAYIWLLIILKLNTEGIVEIWEAVVTLLQFPLLVWFAYCLDVKFKLPCLSRSNRVGLLENSDSRELLTVTETKHNYLEYRRNAMKAVGGAHRDDLNKELVHHHYEPEFDHEGKTADPYCKVTFQHSEHSTEWKKMSLNPQWNKFFVFDIDSEAEQTLVFEVYDHDDLTTDDFMGSAQMNLPSVALGDNVTEVLHLVNGEMKGDVGSIAVNVMKIKNILKKDGAEMQLMVYIESGKNLPGMEKSSRLANALASGLGRCVIAPWKSLKASYIEQFREAVRPGGEGDTLTGTDCMMHFLTIFWKVIFCVIPPPHLGGGWPCFLVALIVIGAVVVLVGEIAGLFGCVVGLSKGMTAITFVALGTSLPDTFASKVAAVQEDTADAALGNITGSNCVNVFLGIGLPWTIAAIYQRAVLGQDLIAISPGFVEGVIVFVGCAVICILTLVLRRLFTGYELGGSNAPLAYATCASFCALWFIYIAMYKYFEIHPIFDVISFPDMKK